MSIVCYQLQYSKCAQADPLSTYCLDLIKKGIKNKVYLFELYFYFVFLHQH